LVALCGISPNGLLASRAGVRRIEHMFEIVFDELLEVVERLAVCGIPADAVAIAQVRGVMDSLEAVVCRAEIGFDVSEGWRERGAGSLRAWLTDEAGLSGTDAGRVAKRVSCLEVWPQVCDAWLGGVLSAAQVDVMCAVVPSRFVSLFSEHAELVVAAVAPLDVVDTKLAVKQWVRMAESADGPEQLREHPSGLHFDTTLDGRAVLQGQFDEASAAVIVAALRDFDVADVLDGNGDIIGPVRTVWQRRADALVSVCSFALSHREGAGDVGRHLPHVSLVVDLPELMAASLRGAGVSTLAELESMSAEQGWSAPEKAWFTNALAFHGEATTFDGVELAATAAAMLSCDSVVQRVLTVGSKVIDLGREVRTAPPPLRRAIISRDRHCRAPGCRREPKFCEVHHVDHWINGGRTDANRLVLLCSFHHHLFHTPGWSMELNDHAELTVHYPGGYTRSTAPRSAGPPVFPRVVQAA